MPDHSKSSSQIKIVGEFTSDPDVCKFVADRKILEGSAMVFHHPEDSQGSPLVDKLFAIDGISRIVITENSVILSRDNEKAWPELAKQIVPAIRRAMTSKVSPVSRQAIEALEAVSRDDIVKAIEQLFQDRINPLLATHGGYVKLLKIEGRDVYLEMGGGCQGCAASRATMQNGIEGAIREVAPDVRNIIDATDHAAGTSPYYAK